jgi:hypothetical protein
MSPLCELGQEEEGLHSLTQLQDLHEANWAIEDLYSDLCWGDMEGSYDPQLTIDVDCLFFAALCPRFAHYKRVLATDDGNYCFFPRVLRASSHLPTTYLFYVKANRQLGYGLGQALVAHRDV